MSISIGVVFPVLAISYCAAVATIGFKSVYDDSKRDIDEPFDEALPEHRFLLGDTLGLGMAATGYGLACADDMTDKLFDSTFMQRLINKCRKLQIRPDGEYFEFKYGERHDNGWNGYTTDKDIPKYKPGKFEMEV
ncbi:hypothetical protein HMPREF1210_01113 [Paenisporosarcina sp. HGH0030]|uniref:hypothetical protein n=1 Tax=Paenisporosarcina sp. HGH0030 TaxID=1078085 RepID=UPI00034E7AD6|nr:hypothetical protein [Paenisporosarcina sp. HGH0030]EPD52733.1 hypothetical protein HMPREF1210_01113 [Paenisporosarcina sp. HGH0030]